MRQQAVLDYQDCRRVRQFHDNTWCQEVTRKSLEVSKDQEAGTSFDLSDSSLLRRPATTSTRDRSP